MTVRISRRRCLQAGAVMGMTYSGVVSAQVSAASKARVILVHREYQAFLPAMDATMDGQVIILEPDVVRHWRDRLQDEVVRAGAVRAYVPWAEAVILAGLGRELGSATDIESAGPLNHVTIDLRSA